MLATFEFQAPCRWRRQAECCSQRPASRPGTRTAPGCTRRALFSQQASLYSRSPHGGVLSVQHVHNRLQPCSLAVMISAMTVLCFTHPSTCFDRCTRPCGALTPTSTSCSTWLARPAHTASRRSSCGLIHRQGSAHCRPETQVRNSAHTPTLRVDMVRSRSAAEGQAVAETPTASARSQPAGDGWCGCRS
jgi:hypothetical protein